MKRKTAAILCLILAALALFAACAPAIAYAEVDPDTPVNIPDPGMRKAVIETLHLPEGGKLIAGDLRKIEVMQTNGTDVDAGYISTDIRNLSGLEYATNLTAIQILNNNTGGLDLRPLSGLKKLNCIFLVQDKISGIGPLSGLNNLTLLDLSVNSISDISPLNGLNNLKQLTLSWNKISDISPLKGLTDLHELWLDNNSISDISPLKGLKNLTGLCLVRNKISDISPLSELINLKSLNLSDNDISDISPLKGLKNLTYLSLDGNEISDISPLSELTKLKSLTIDQDTYDSNQDTVAILEQRGCNVDTF